MLIPKYRQFSLVGLVINVEDDGASLMQNPNAIEKVITSFRKTKRRINCIGNVSFNERIFVVKIEFNEGVED